MKRFIRTKDGKIIDTTLKTLEMKKVKGEKNKYYITNKMGDFYLIHFAPFEIIKEADTIERLIEVGDLVKVLGREICEVHLEYSYLGITNKSGHHYLHHISYNELYTKQGRNYVLVAEKIDGEWRVL